MSETLQRFTGTPADMNIDGKKPDNEEVTTEYADNNPLITKLQFGLQYIVGAISLMLMIRFLLALFGTNEAIAAVSLINSVTNPLVAPFAVLYGQEEFATTARFEIETLVAIIFYILAGIGVIRLLDVFRK